MILLYPKNDATWEQMSLWLENAYSDPAWKWNGFGTVGTEGFKIALIRRPGYDDEEDKDEEDEDEEDEWCEEHEQVMYKDGYKCSGCLDQEEEEAT